MLINQGLSQTVAVGIILQETFCEKLGWCKLRSVSVSVGRVSARRGGADTLTECCHVLC